MVYPYIFGLIRPFKTVSTIGKEVGHVTDRVITEEKIRVEVNGLHPLEMKIEIQLPDDVTEVEFEYQKVEEHCVTCFSLFHAECDCSLMSHQDTQPKNRVMGITQRIVLLRIEAEKKHHDDRRGYRRPDSHQALRTSDDHQGCPRRERPEDIHCY